MIIKTDKNGNEVESWPTLAEAAKAIGVSPKVLKGHINKKKPPKLFGFVFKETEDKPLVFKTPTLQKDLDTEGLRRFIAYTPEAFDIAKLSPLIADEAGIFPKIIEGDIFRHEWETKEGLEKPIELDEFGEPIIPPIPEEAQGSPSIPPELIENELLITVDEEEPIDKEKIADYLRTPLERRLHAIKHKNI